MVASLATKLEFLVAKEKTLVALATVSVAISSPVHNMNVRCHLLRQKNKHDQRAQKVVSDSPGLLLG